MSSIETLLNMDYEQLVNYLKQKYGPVKGNFFTNETCKYQNKSIKRTSEGLYIHHVDEDKAIMLSTSEFAIKNPYDFQLANRLVYCDMLEHLLLHIKIVEHPHPNRNQNEMVGIGGIFNFILPELNDIYSGIQYKLEWKNTCLKKVIDRKQEFFTYLKYFMHRFPQFPIQLYTTSFNAKYNIWSESNNKIIYEEIKQLFHQN